LPTRGTSSDILASDPGTLVGKIAPTTAGLGGNGTGWTVNSSGISSPPITKDVLTLTDGSTLETRSAWDNTPVPAGSFSASFSYQGKLATGRQRNAATVAFVLQSAGLNTPGGGYPQTSSITPSVSLVFFHSFNPSLNTTTPYVYFTAIDAGGTRVANTFASTGNVDPLAGDPIDVALNYNDGDQVLVVTLTDTKTGASFGTSFNLNLTLANIVGNTAYLGFTASNNALGATQTVRNFVFNSLASGAPIQAGGGGTATFSSSTTANLFGLAPGPYFLYTTVADGVNPVAFSPLSLTTVAGLTPTIQGTVTAANGSAVAGARITIDLGGGSSPTTVTTDTSGYFFFDGPTSGYPYTATATLTVPYGYSLPNGTSAQQTTSLTSLSLGATLNWSLQQNAAVSGAITDPVAGQPAFPLAGVTVFDDLHGTGILEPDDPVTTTDDQGHYTLFNEAQGVHHIVVVLPAGLTTTTNSQTVNLSSASDVMGGVNFDMSLQSGAPPTSTITYPGPAANDLESWAGAISGTAHDPVNYAHLASVQVSVQDEATGNYWDGNSFSSSTPVNLTADGTTAWSLPLPASALTPGDTYLVTSTVVDANKIAQTDSSTRTFELASPTLSIALPPALPGATVGVSYSTSVGGAAGYTFQVTAGSLPPGLTLNPSTGLISGTPTSTSGSAYSFTISATDAAGDSGTQTYAVAVVSPPAPTTPPTDNNQAPLLSPPTTPAPVLRLTAPQLLKAHGLIVGLARHGIILSLPSRNSATQMRITASLGKLRLYAAGVKIEGNNSAVLTVSGPAAAVKRALAGVALVFTGPHRKARLTIAVTQGGRHAHTTISVTM
jgi:hypothetical protein